VVRRKPASEHASASGPAAAGGEWSQTAAGAAAAADLPTHSLLKASPSASAPSAAEVGADSRAFAIGELVADRWRIVRFIARGGMGEVYEAEDTALKEIVALKTVLPEIAANDRAIERFTREVSVARQVTHRHVCRIHDLGTHRSTSAVAARYPKGEIPFVTMEMLRGEPLSARLLRGRFSPEEALPLIRQMAAGLDAAHAVGIVHRDFKGGNVILEPAADGVRAVVTDFGLARGMQPDGRFSATVTMGDGLLGSPAYMAPEQVDGRTAGPRADVYAFGTVVYEMVTGSLPFRADNPLATAIKRLTENPIPPREVRPDLDDRWERALLRALDRSPEARFASAGELVAALEGRLEEPPTREELEAAARRPPPKRLALAVVAGVLVAAAFFAWFNVWQRRQVAEPLEAGLTIPTTARSTVAVLGFAPLSEDSELEWLATALVEMMASELSRSSGVRLVPSESVARFLRESAIEDLRTLSAETLTRVRSALGADYVLIGTFASIGAPPERQLRIDAKLQDTRAEGRGGAAAATAPEGEVFGLVAKLGSELRSSLGLEQVASATPPTDVSAERAYAEGLERLHAFDYAGARDRLVAAVEAAPAEPRYHGALARAWMALGYWERAASEVDLALEARAVLAPGEVAQLEILRLEARGRAGEAATAAHELWRANPDDVDAGLAAARLLEAAGRSLEAGPLLQVLERLPSSAAADPRIALAKARMFASSGDFRKQLSAASAAREAAEAAGAVGVAARALLAESEAQRQLGEMTAARATVDRARDLLRQVGDKPGAIAATTQAGALAFQAADLAGAKRLFAEALAAARELGDRRVELSIRNNLAVVTRQLGEVESADREYQALIAIAEETGDRYALVQGYINRGATLAHRGRLAEAKTLFLAARPIADQLGDRSLVASTRASLALVARRMGDLATASAEQEAAVAIRREIGQKAAESSSLVDIGWVAFLRGQLESAESSWNQALAIAREVGAKRFEASALDGLGRLAAARGDQVKTRERHEEALALRRESGDPVAVAESRLALAKLDLEQGQREDAQLALRDLIPELRRLGADDVVAEAEAALAMVELSGRRTTEARSSVDAAVARLAQTQNVLVAHDVAVASARVAAGLDRESEARRRLEDAAERAKSLGFVGQELEAEWYLGQLEGGAAGTRRLDEVKRRASELGFRIWAGV
jgi:tetratricopeptide (TPR) repeat protein/TolB-like protein